MWYGRGKRFIYYRVARGQHHWAAIVNAQPGDMSFRDGQTKAALLDWYRGWQEPIESMIQATDESEISRVDIYGRRPLNTWGSGRVTMLGDAAHPITLNLGQGACQAIEDAVVLAKHLRSAPDPVTGLRTYEAARMERTADLMTRAWRFGVIGQLNNPVLCWAREKGMRAVRNKVERETTATSAYEV
jgi:2-polyprenyl-6-methoxyphenol hydroxylase-like FAD-dependent oxidoreductase